MKRRNRIFPVQDLARAYAKSVGKEDEYLQAKVKNHWQEITSPAVASQTIGIFFADKKMYVKIESAVLRAELEKYKLQFTQKINAFVNKNLIDTLVFFT